MQQISEEKSVHFDKIVYDVIQNTICANNEIVGYFDKKMRYIEGIPEFSFEETLEHAQKETNIINQQKEKQMISERYHER